MVRAYASTDVGKTREINEDYFYISNIQDPIQVFILADGMGGYNGGEIASRLAVESAKYYILTNFDNSKENKETILNLVREASNYANTAVYEKAKASEEYSSMGTTLDICLFYHGKVFISHVGDSRIYRKRNNFFRKLTKDHSYVQELVDEGKITKEESLNHPKKNMLMKAIGAESIVEPDTMCRGFINGDTFLMCSDGLTNMVSEEEIIKIIERNEEDATKMLVQKANDMGGKDNITAIIIR